MTLSKYAVSSSVRRSLPLATDFSKFFDLDRCISVTRLPVEGSEKQFVLINVHLSAYDEGGRIRALQTEMLNEIFETERAKGNYVVAGGDFNQILRETNFPDKQQRPTWVADFPQSELPQGYCVCAPENAPTCRGADIPYEKDVNYTCVIDGFIVSDNVTVTAVETQDLQFAYSDHNPVKLTFSLMH
jgi:endonuclease/exonuclease/phosphatase family metal-dependent hydrolase